MRFRIGQLAFVLCLLAASAARGGAQCRSADSSGTDMLEKYKSDLRSTDPYMRLELSRNGISQVDPNTVVLVTDRTVCSKAMKAYNTAASGNGVTPSGSVYVVKIGTVYVVKDPVQTSTGWELEVVLDSQFKVIAKLLA